MLDSCEAPLGRNGRTSAQTPTRVLFLLPTLNGGGAERTVLTLIPHLRACGLDARIGLLARGGAFDGEINPAGVLLTRLGTRKMGRVFLTRPALDGTSYASRPDFSRILTGIPLVPLHQLDLIRQFRPHVVMSCTHSMNLAALLSTRAYGRRRVAWILREGINTRAIIDAISHGVADGLVRDFWVPRDRLCVIHNPVEVSHVSRLAKEADGACPPARFIVACGRLHRQKGFDLLLQAFARLGIADLALVLLGEGPERSHLESLARELGIASRVVMPGFVANPWHWMARAAAFVLPSRYEGFGSVLVEAMACGTPVVATDCEYGPREILFDGEAGLLARAEDIDSLTAAIGNVLANPDFAHELAVRGRRRALEFDAPAIAGRYADLMRETARPAGDEGRR
jgi:glycosyltransferase involved in cell wall biosynthesis